MSTVQDPAPKLVFSGPSLLSWRQVDSNWPEEGKTFKKATEGQVCFVGDTLPKAYCTRREEYRYAVDGLGVQVIGGHRSKSCDLPVYGLDIPHLGVRAVLSDNFHGWVVSVETPKLVDLSMMEGRMSTKPCDPMYCSGFRGDWVLGAYENIETRAFTVEMWSQYDVYALFMTIAHQLRTVA